MCGVCDYRGDYDWWVPGGSGYKFVPECGGLACSRGNMPVDPISGKLSKNSWVLKIEVEEYSLCREVLT